MEKKIAVIGGDLRSVYLAGMLAKKHNVISFGQEMAKIKTEAMKIDNLKSAIEISDIIIGPVPFSKDGKNVQTIYSSQKIEIDELVKYCKGKILIAGAIPNEVIALAKELDIRVIDIMKIESLTVLNTIATAEGTLEIAMRNTKKVLHGSKVLVLGYGRVAKVVAKVFSAVEAEVTCAVRKPEAFAWIEVDGFKAININELGKNLGEFDIIINTPPTLILNRKKLRLIKKDCLVIDLASYPGGVDVEAAKELNINFEWALGLPGKVAPITAAEHIYKVLREVIL